MEKRCLGRTLLSIIIILGLLFSNVYAQPLDNNQTREKDIRFIMKHYDMCREDVLEIADETFNVLKNEVPSEVREETKYYMLVEDDEENFIYEEITEEEFKTAKNKVDKYNKAKKNNDEEGIMEILSNNEVTSNHGWVSLTTRISYLAISDIYLITNNTNYLQTSYATYSNTIGYFTGIGTNHHMSIINTSPFFRLTYNRTIAGNTTSHDIVRQWADTTTSEGYGFYFELYNYADTTYSNVSVRTHVEAKAIQPGPLQVADAYGHFAHRKGIITISPSVFIKGANISLGTTNQTTVINPNHVQLIR